MTGRTPPTTIRERAHGNTTEARHWLRTQYGRLRKRMAARYPPWADLAAEMAAAGLSGGTRTNPKPLTTRAVEKMWKGVCRDIEADASKRAPKPPAEAARWTPKVVAAGKPAGSGTAEQEGYDVWADIDRRSGRA